MEGVTRDALVSSSLALSAGGSISDRLDPPTLSDTKKYEQLNDAADNYMYGCRFFGMFKSDVSVVDEVIAARRKDPRA